MKHVKILSHEMPALAREETAPVTLKNILDWWNPAGALSATQVTAVRSYMDAWLQK